MSINGFEPTPWAGSDLDPNGPDWNRQELPSDEVDGEDEPQLDDSQESR